MELDELLTQINFKPETPEQEAALASMAEKMDDQRLQQVKALLALSEEHAQRAYRCAESLATTWIRTRERFNHEIPVQELLVRAYIIGRYEERQEPKKTEL